MKNCTQGWLWLFCEFSNHGDFKQYIYICLESLGGNYYAYCIQWAESSGSKRGSQKSFLVYVLGGQFSLVWIGSIVASGTYFFSSK